MIIVTGSKGFIGQNFLKALKDKEIKEVDDIPLTPTTTSGILTLLKSYSS